MRAGLSGPLFLGSMGTVMAFTDNPGAPWVMAASVVSLFAIMVIDAIVEGYIARKERR